MPPRRESTKSEVNAMQSTSAQAGTPKRAKFPAPRGDFRTGLLVGLTPLARLVVSTALVIALTIISRLISAAGGFFFQQQVTLIVLVVGLLTAAVLYTIGCVSVLRKVGAWGQASDPTKRAGALWALAATALVVLLPVVLAVILPQNPAP